MKHLFVPYEIALIAKEKGFDDECLGFYVGNDLNIGKESNSSILAGLTKNTLTPCPLYQQLSDWLREEKGLICSITPAYADEYCIFWCGSNTDGEELANILQMKIISSDKPSTSSDYYKLYNNALIEALNII